MKIIKDIYKEAVKLDACDKFTGKENYKDIVDLMLSEQGIEFCLKNSFPKVEVFRKFEKYNPQNDGVFIDVGSAELENIPTVFLVGNTNAVLRFNNLDTNYRVVLMHGATATIIATNYAVVALYGATEENVKIEVSNNAMVL